MKKIILCFIVILLTGCSTEYNLEFKNGKFNDNIKIGEFYKDNISDFDTLEPIASYKDYDIKYYDFNYKNNYLYLNHEYLYNEYRVSTALIDCFELSNISSDKDYYYILTSGSFKCMSYLGYKNDTVKVNFSTDLEVESANADTVINNKYIWIFNDSNYKNKEINIKLKKAHDNKIEKEKSKKLGLTTEYFIIIIPLLIIIYLAFIKFKKYSDKKNDFNE